MAGTAKASRPAPRCADVEAATAASNSDMMTHAGKPATAASVAATAGTGPNRLMLHAAASASSGRRNRWGSGTVGRAAPMPPVTPPPPPPPPGVGPSPWACAALAAMVEAIVMCSVRIRNGNGHAGWICTRRRTCLKPLQRRTRSVSSCDSLRPSTSSPARATEPHVSFFDP